MLHTIVRGMDVEFQNKDHEEGVVRKLSTGLVTVLKDNPDFVKMINGLLED